MRCFIMATEAPLGAKTAPSTARNRDAIRDVLKRRLPLTGMILEIAAGAGEHTTFNAAAFPALQWQPTDADPEAIASIAAWRKHAALSNVLAPILLDATCPSHWPVKRADAIININMIHISPWAATRGLMSGASRVLEPNGMLFLYGPFIETGVETAQSNLAFNVKLRERNIAWGVRHLDEVTRVAKLNQLVLAERIAMPANNLCVIYRKIEAHPLQREG